MSLAPAVALAFIATLLALFFLRPVAFALALVDKPGGRKKHSGIVPVVGGICMFTGILLVLPLIEPQVWASGSFLAAAGLLTVVGAIDDRFDLAPRGRLIAQAAAGLITCYGAGLVANNIGSVFFFGDVTLGAVAPLFTILVIMSCVNAFNFLDGLDGLASGVALSSCLCVIAAALLHQTTVGVSIALLACAVISAFLIFNFPTSLNRGLRTFMGDAGATMLGFLVVWLGLLMSNGPDAFIPAAAALWIAALPISDFFVSFVRRLSRGQNPMSADREHFHHYLQRAGLTDRQVMIVMSGLSLSLGLIGISANQAGVPDGVLFFSFLALCVFQNWGMRRMDGIIQTFLRVGGTRASD
jgi:UDP-GlcNAc:undecaprenyl-phosphate GlcNAc-1-phosphate transferase